MNGNEDMIWMEVAHLVSDMRLSNLIPGLDSPALSSCALVPEQTVSQWNYFQNPVTKSSSCSAAIHTRPPHLLSCSSSLLCPVSSLLHLLT